MDFKDTVMVTLVCMMTLAGYVLGLVIGKWSARSESESTNRYLRGEKPCANCIHPLSRHTGNGEGLCLDCNCVGWVRSSKHD
jgi:hypothetical protein